MLTIVAVFEFVFIFAVMKAVVGRKGDFSVKIKSDLRQKEKAVMDAFVSPKLGKDCVCPILQSQSGMYYNFMLLSKFTMYYSTT